jgi:hypothetical protein
VQSLHSQVRSCSLCELRDKLQLQIQHHHGVYEGVTDCIFGLQVIHNRSSVLRNCCQGIVCRDVTRVTAGAGA